MDMNPKVQPPAWLLLPASLKMLFCKGPSSNWNKRLFSFSIEIWEFESWLSTPRLEGPLLTL